MLSGSTLPAIANQDMGLAYRGWRMQSAKITGVDKEIAKELEKGLALTLDRGWLGFLSKPSYEPDVLTEDLQRTQLFLATRGYPDARVEARFQPNESLQQVQIVLHVEPGPRVLVSDLQVPGLPESLTPRIKELGMKAGDPFVDTKVTAAQDSLSKRLLEAGYAQARVSRQIERIDPHSARVTFRVDPGDVFHYRDIEYKGPDADLLELARKAADIEPGAVASTKTLSDARTRLNRLDLFRRTTFEANAVGPGEMDLTCLLSEREQRTYELGIAAWSDGIIEGTASWTHRNLFGGGRGFEVRADASQVEQETSVSGWQPCLLGPQTRFTLAVRGRHEDESSYENWTVETEAVLSFDLSLDRIHDLTTALVYSQQDYTRVTSGEEAPSGRLFSTTIDWVNDTSDNPFNPRRGAVYNAAFEVTVPKLSTNTDFVRLELSGVKYQSLPGAVWAVRAKPGAVEPYGGATTVPPDRLFYGGGALSMRGFGRHELGPRDANGTPTGGRVLMELSTELRVRVWWKFVIAGFVDAAQVWEDVEKVTLDNVEVAIGPGIGIETPIGPIRADTGFRLTDYDTTQPSWVFHLYIGNPY
jgi:translocation and assembly module TamA